MKKLFLTIFSFITVMLYSQKVDSNKVYTASYYAYSTTRYTASGQKFNNYGLTAAHKTLPMNTVVRVYNQDNGKSIIVRINDRGPFVRGRIIDLSNKAARDIDMVGKGTAKVKVTVLGYNGEIENADAPYSEVSQSETNIRKKEKIDVLEPLEIKEDSISSSKVPVMNKSTKVVKTTPIVNSNNNNKVLSSG